jgi:hypothetical protein
MQQREGTPHVSGDGGNFNKLLEGGEDNFFYKYKLQDFLLCGGSSFQNVILAFGHKKSKSRSLIYGLRFAIAEG